VFVLEQTRRLRLLTASPCSGGREQSPLAFARLAARAFPSLAQMITASSSSPECYKPFVDATPPSQWAVAILDLSYCLCESRKEIGRAFAIF
jgi:hypothetical protein